MRKSILTTFFLMIVMLFSVSLAACGKKTEQSFDVSFYSGNGELVTTVNTEDSAQLEDELLSIVKKQSTEKYEYKFVGWYTSEQGGKQVTSVNDINEKTSLYPRFEEVLKRFNVRFYNAEGKVLFTNNVGYGSPAYYYGETPIKAPTNEYTFKFVEWDCDFSNVTTDLNVYPIFEAFERSYTVSFKNYDGDVLQSKSYKYGEEVVYQGDIPCKVEDEAYEYEFAGWNSEVTAVSGDKEYIATFNSIVKQFLVEFYIDDELLTSYLVDYGCDLVEIPEVPAVRGFDGVWDKDYFNNITTNLVVNAVYTPSKYTVSFDMEGDTTADCQDIVLEFGDSYSLPEFTGYRFGYEFLGWEKDGNSYSPGQVFTISDKNVIYKAKWKQIKFSVYLGTQNFQDYYNDCQIYMFENGVLAVYAKTYVLDPSLKNSSEYSISIVLGNYELIDNYIDVRLSTIYSFSYNSDNQTKMSYDNSFYHDATYLTGSVNGDVIAADGIEYHLLSKDNYIEDYIFNGRQVVGIVLDKNANVLEGEHFKPNYAVVIYSDLTLEISNDFEIYGFSTAAGSGEFDVMYDNSRFTFDYNVVTEEEAERLDFEGISGSQFFLIGSEMGYYFYSAVYCNGFRQENYTIDPSCISGFDTSTGGVKTLTFTLDQGVFYLDIYVLEDIDDILYFEDYFDTFIYETKELGYNVFLKDSEVTSVGVKYANCSVAYPKLISGQNLVDSYEIRTLEVEPGTIDTSKPGYYKVKLNIDGKLIQIEYAVLDEANYYKIDSYGLYLEEGTRYLVGDTITTKIRISYGYGNRIEVVDLDKVSNAEVVGATTVSKGVKTIQLVVDGVVVDSEDIVVFEDAEKHLIEKKYFVDDAGSYLTENIFVQNEVVDGVYVKYSQVEYLYSSNASMFIEGVEFISYSDIDTTVLGLKTIDVAINNSIYQVNYLIVRQKDYLTVTDFNIVGTVNYLVGENVDLQLELIYGDDYRKEIIDASAFVSKCDNKTTGVKVLTIEYLGISKQIQVYYFDGIYGYIDYNYYINTLVEDNEYKTHNIFYQNQKVNCLKIGRVNVRRFYDGTSISQNELVDFNLNEALNTSETGKKKYNIDDLLGKIYVEYHVLDDFSYYNETRYEILGNRVLTEGSGNNLQLVKEYSNGLRHEIVDIDINDIEEFSWDVTGQQFVSFTHDNKQYYLSLFSNDGLDDSKFYETEYLDTSLKDYENIVSISDEYFVLQVVFTYKTLNSFGEIINEEKLLGTMYVDNTYELELGINVISFNYFYKVINVQIIVEE